MQGLTHLAEVVARSNTEQAVAEDDFSIAAQLVRHEVSHLQCTPSMARLMCLDDDLRASLSGVKHLMIGGEALPGALIADLKAAAPQASLTNMYGPTETTIWSSTASEPAADGTAGLGRPIANTRFYVMDAQGVPCPVGTEGELYIGGAGVTRGYLNRPELTAERFVQTGQGRLYRTGDLVRVEPDGSIAFLGRVDHQIKLRGYRIELGEIEAALEAHADVSQAVVVAREDTPGDVRLVAYVKGGADVTRLRQQLAADMPAHMVPAHIQSIADFPLTPNKKVDRNALPAPVDTALAAAPRPAAPPTQAPIQTAGDTAGIERQIAEIWQRTLGVASVRANDNFFDLGGHSLLAVQAHREIKQAVGGKVSITDIFRFPVLSALAAQIAQAGGTSGAAAEPARAAPAPQDTAGAPKSARADAMAKRRAMRAARMRR